MKVLYHTEVERIISTLPKEYGSRVLKVIDLFEDYKFNLIQAYLKKIARGIWELRGGRYRLLFGIIKGDTIIVNMFMKKTQKTPKQAIDLAIKRLKEYEK